MKSAAFEWKHIPATPTRVGAVRKFFRMPTPLLAELECHVTTLNPGESPHPPHQHRAEEILILKEGKLRVQLINELQEIGEGSVVFVASNELHGWTNVSDVPATYHVIQWQTKSNE